MKKDGGKTEKGRKKEIGKKRKKKKKRNREENQRKVEWKTRESSNFTKRFDQMWHKAVWMEHPMRIKLTCEGLLVLLANNYTTRSPRREKERKKGKKCRKNIGKKRENEKKKKRITRVKRSQLIFMIKGVKGMWDYRKKGRKKERKKEER